MISTQVLGITIVFLMSLWRGIGLPKNWDLIALFIAFQGLILWHFTNNPMAALLIVIAVDSIGVILTLIKAYKQPATETVSIWAMAGLAGVVTLATVNDYSISILLYPIYTITLNICVLVAIFTGERKPRVFKSVKIKFSKDAIISEEAL